MFFEKRGWIKLGILFIIVVIIILGFVFFFNKFNIDKTVERGPSEISGLKANNTGFGSHVLITWTDLPVKPSNGYYVVRSEVIDGAAFNERSPFIEIGSSRGNFILDLTAEDDTMYEYRVIPQYGASMTTEDIIKSSNRIRITPEKYNVTYEKIAFVIPYQSKDYTNLEDILKSFVDKLNKLYSKTEKSFVFGGIKFYDLGLYQGDYKVIQDNRKYYEPGAIMVYYLPEELALAACKQGIPPSVFVSYDELKEQLMTNKILEKHVMMLGHEIAHTFGVGVPEYYTYTSATGKVEVLPLEYLKDIMYSFSFQLEDAEFGPLSFYIINNNLGHSKPQYWNHKSQIDYLKLYPKNILIKIKDSVNSPLEDVSVKIYCVREFDIRRGVKKPKPLLMDTKTTNNKGEVNLDLTDEFQNKIMGGLCVVLEIITNKDGFTPKTTYITNLEMQESKLIHDKDIHTLEIEMA